MLGVLILRSHAVYISSSLPLYSAFAATPRRCATMSLPAGPGSVENVVASTIGGISSIRYLTGSCKHSALWLFLTTSGLQRPPSPSASGTIS